MWFGLYSTYKAKPNVMCNGNTPFSIAIRLGHLNIVQLLLDHHAEFDKAALIRRARESGYSDLEKLLAMQQNNASS